MAYTFVQIGNSKALIIPAKIIRAKKYDNKTEFDIIETNDGFRIVQKRHSLDSLTFPKLDSLTFPKTARPVISQKIKGITGVVNFTAEQLKQDERLKYILSR